MKTARLLFILFLTSLACSAQQARQEQRKERQDLHSISEQEEGLTSTLFRENYYYHEYPRFSGAIRVKESTQGLTLCYNQDTLQLANLDRPFAPLFAKGILHPRVANEYFRWIGSIHELSETLHSDQCKRFTLLASNGLTERPVTYLFELTNAQAQADTDLRTFLEGAVLTFIMPGWLL